MTSEMNPVVRAWLESPTAGGVEFARDGDEAAVAGLVLRRTDGTAVRATFAPAAPGVVAVRYGYYVTEHGRVRFVLPRPAGVEDAVFVAGDFNGWGAAVGDPAWCLTPATLAGEAILACEVDAARVLTRPWQRFKFVTAEHQWIGVADDAPNSVRDDAGHLNLALDPDRTGRQVVSFTLAEPLDLAEVGVVERAGSGERVAVEPGAFFFALATDLPLGAIVTPEATQFRLFVPRGRAVRVQFAATLAELAGAPEVSLQRRADAPAVWEATVGRSLHGWFYWYAVDGAPGGEGASATNARVLDPYARAAVGREGPGIVLDAAWIGAGDRQPAPQWQDLVIAEGHVRDLAANAPVPATPEERLGFEGLRRWVESPEFYLTHLGVNCLELQPVQEFDNRTREEYHWGYMPVNWFAPASAYAMDPAKASGVRECQALVAACHRRGIAVLLDVVYNHVGVPEHLMGIDRLYYFQDDAAGRLTNWSGCGNDVRANAAMAKRLIIDSCRHWIEAYGVDGFRFDLAELLGLEVLREIEAALKQTKPDVILIAEPWSFRGHIAGALRDTGWSSWNDNYRDFIREFVRGGGTAERFAYFLKGSPWYWAKWPAQTVNYTESHDDRAWIDLITENPGFDGSHPTAADRARTHLMAAALFASLGIPMIAAGQDFLRSKQGVNNTYLRGDLNALDYRRIARFPGTHAYFADWIAFRRSERGRLLRLYSPPGEGFFHFVAAPGSNACALVYNADGSHGGGRLLFAINPTTNDAWVPLGETLVAAGAWRQLADHERFFDVAAHGGMTLPLEPQLFLPALSCGLWACG